MGSFAVDQVQAALAVLEAVDPHKLPDGELHDVFVAVEKARDRLAVCAGRLGGAWERRRVWSSNQSLSPQQRLANEKRCDVRTARREIRRARKLATMPATRAAIRDGKLSLDLLDVLGRANSGKRRKLFAEHEQTLVEQCSKLRFPDAVKAIAYWVMRANAEVGEPELPAPKTEVFLSPVADRWALDGDLDAISGTILHDELERLMRALYLADKKAGIERTNAERRAAALVAMATRSASAAGSGAKRRPLFTVHVGDGTLADLCELANGMLVTPKQLAGWLDAAMMETILFAGPSTIMSVSHRRRFTGALRRAIEARDRHCQHPSGCDAPVERCDVDHIVPVAAGGITDQWDGHLECHPHNRNEHLHDHDTQPLPMTPVDRLEAWRCRLRWRVLHDPPDD